MSADDTAHIDTFARDNLPPKELWPEFRFDLPELNYPDRLNAGALLDRAIGKGWGGHIAIREPCWTYSELNDVANRYAQSLSSLPPGTRVLLHAKNRATTVAAWFGILKAGHIVVATMPMLRPLELATIIMKAQVGYEICDQDLAGVVREAKQEVWRRSPAKQHRDSLHRGSGSDPRGGSSLLVELDRQPQPTRMPFDPIMTSKDDPALIAFTSGTTGVPKGCVHFHRDVMAMADTFARHILKPGPDEIFCGTPPIAFTFGLGGSVVFPLAFGASTVFPEKPGYEELCRTIEKHRVTTLFTAPTAYRALTKMADRFDLASLRKCVSAGEPLPRATSDGWLEKTGIRIIDGIGSTEMIHIFISASGKDIRPGATGKPVPGYTATILDEENNPVLGPGQGRLAVKGPTGCRYLADERQKNYVVNGWNVTGDVYRVDEDGYFWFVSRADDMIISAGYNIAGPEVEAALLAHDKVAECAVVGAPDAERGQIVKAFVVLHEGCAPTPALVDELQDFVKQRIAPYKYPRLVDFVRELPKTQTGKLQRFKLREHRQ